MSGGEDLSSEELVDNWEVVGDKDASEAEIINLISETVAPEVERHVAETIEGLSSVDKSSPRSDSVRENAANAQVFQSHPLQATQNPPKATGRFCQLSVGAELSLSCTTYWVLTPTSKLSKQWVGIKGWDHAHNKNVMYLFGNASDSLSDDASNIFHCYRNFTWTPGSPLMFMFDPISRRVTVVTEHGGDVTACIIGMSSTSQATKFRVHWCGFDDDTLQSENELSNVVWQSDFRILEKQATKVVDNEKPAIVSSPSHARTTPAARNYEPFLRRYHLCWSFGGLIFSLLLLSFCIWNHHYHAHHPDYELGNHTKSCDCPMMSEVNGWPPRSGEVLILHTPDNSADGRYENGPADYFRLHDDVPGDAMLGFRGAVPESNHESAAPVTTIELTAPYSSGCASTADSSCQEIPLLLSFAHNDNAFAMNIDSARLEKGDGVAFSTQEANPASDIISPEMAEHSLGIHQDLDTINELRSEVQAKTKENESLKARVAALETVQWWMCERPIFNFEAAWEAFSFRKSKTFDNAATNVIDEELESSSPPCEEGDNVFISQLNAYGESEFSHRGTQVAENLESSRKVSASDSTSTEAFESKNDFSGQVSLNNALAAPTEEIFVMQVGRQVVVFN